MSKNTDAIALLEKHFDIVFAAPDGIKKLRELILSLAMQGKLVAQDSSDQPASDLLKEIEAEKERLIKEGKIKKSKPLPEIKLDEISYDLPKSWEWVRLPYCYFGIGSKNNQIQTNDYLESGLYPVIDQGKFFIAGYCNDKNKLLEIEKPVIVFGDHTKNIKFVNFHFIIGADGVKILCPFNGIFPRYLYFAIQSYKLTDRGYARHFKVLNEKLLAIPPLAEQHRIVDKIDELMARCDELERLRGGRDRKQITVHTAALNRLLIAKEQSDFNAAWQFITQHFGELYSVKGNITELRKAILQLAVMGKLVPQDPNDQPASELLKKIEEDKERLVKEGKIKKSKPLPEIKRDEIPYNLPKSWEWVCLSNITESIDYGTSHKTVDNSTMIPVYRMGNIVDGHLVNSNFKYINEDIDDLPRLYLQKMDILFNRTNSYELVGKSAIYLGDDNKATFASYLIRIRLIKKEIMPTYIIRVINSAYFRKTQIEPEIVQQCGQANFNGSKLSLCLFPLPPLAEQQRIVAEIDQIMALCDNLEKQIDNANSKQTSLLNAVMTKI